MTQSTTFLSFAVPAALLIAGSLFCFQDPGKDKQPKKPAPAAEPDMQDFIDKAGPEHAMLLKDAGTWDAEIQDVDGSKGRAHSIESHICFQTLRRSLARVSTRATSWGRRSSATSSLDTTHTPRRFLSTWHDITSSQIMISEGTYDPKTRTLVLKSEMLNPMNPTEKVKYVNSTVWKSDDHKISHHARDPRRRQRVGWNGDGAQAPKVSPSPTTRQRSPFVSDTHSPSIHTRQIYWDPNDMTNPLAPAATAEHEWFRRHVGEWDAAITATLYPGAQPMEWKGDMTIVLGCGGMWEIMDFRGDMGASPLRGTASPASTRRNNNTSSVGSTRCRRRFCCFRDPSTKPPKR